MSELPLVVDYVPLNGRATPAVSDDLLARAKQYVDEWKPRLRLMDWDIGVEIKEASNANHLAESESEWRVRRALITIPPDYIQRVTEQRLCLPSETPEKELRRSVVHELLHICEEPLASRVGDEIQWFVGTRAETGGVLGAELRNGWRDYREWWINQMVRILVDSEPQA